MYTGTETLAKLTTHLHAVFDQVKRLYKQSGRHPVEHVKNVREVLIHARLINDAILLMKYVAKCTV